MIPKGSAWVDYTFPSGVAHVELIPETSKLDVNFVPPEQPHAPDDGARCGPGRGRTDRAAESWRAGWAAQRQEFPAFGSVFSRTLQRLSKR